jgi:hypothetical protein
MALLVSMMLMVLITTTMTLTVVHVQIVQDYARNAKVLQAADSGVAHGGAVLNQALAAWSIPAATTATMVHAYADDAESGSREGDRDISLVKDTATHVGQVLPRGADTTTGYTEQGGAGALTVDYGAAVDITPTGVERPAAGDISERHLFHYDYSITGGGASQIGGKQNRATRMEQGQFDVEVKRPSFSTYGYFTQSMKNQFNQQLVFFDGEVYSGPTHVNSAPPEGRAGFYGRPVFNGPFTAVQGTYAESWLGGNANPQFNAGATWGVQQLELPSNGYSQLRAAIGDYANIEDQTPLTPAQLAAKLGVNLVNGQVPAGVYYKQGDSGSNPGALLGGVLIYGDAQSIAFSVSGNTQVIRIEGAGGTYTFNDNHSAGTLSVTSPNGSDSFNHSLNGMIHTEGKVSAVSGDSSQSSPDIQSQEQVTVSATGNIYITTHITYQDDPLANPNARNVLGLFSSNGNIYLGQNAPNNLTVNATVMAASTGHGVGAEGIVSGGSYNYNYPNKGYWNLLGGLIENKDQTTGVYYSNGKLTGYIWNFTYDNRFSSGLAPPFFPYVTKFTVSMQHKEAEAWGRKYY